ncbi:MAG TPA: carboxypeptidase-like regulatory domain-containing protein [Vicinamibacterales bacterium]|nr:carboxypeptidase-like regulatory domain-containing protein [Vicinamibacterales bacterium]
MSIARVTTCRFCPGWLTGLILWVGVLALLFAGGCRRGVPVVDLGPKPPAARGTITGIVHGPEGTSAMSGRTVEVVNVATGEHRTVQTQANGGFTIELPAGKYRVELALLDGETLIKKPGIVDLERGDIDSHDFVVGPARISRPRNPSYQVDNGLGSPIA